MREGAEPEGGHDEGSLSVVVIGLNEARNLPRCFASVREAVARAGGLVALRELIYVDSGSQDGSLELACAQADAVYRLTGRPSAAAARQAGLANATGALVLFLDGDMALDAGWLAAAAGFLRREPDPAIAGVAGVRDDVYVDEATGAVVGERPNVYGVAARRAAPHFGGAVLGRRAAFLRVGGYDPRLRSGEEADLHARLLHAGLRVEELPVPFIRHFTPRPEGAWRRARRAMRPGSPLTGIGRSFFAAVRAGYWPGLARLYRANLVVWGADALALAALALTRQAGPPLAVQLAALVALGLMRRPKAFALARLHYVAIALAAWQGRAADGEPAYERVA